MGQGEESGDELQHLQFSIALLFEELIRVVAGYVHL